MGQIFDWDGTITGIPKAMIVRDQPFYVSSLCESRPNWGNMSICPHQYVSAEGTGSGYQKTSIIIKYIIDIPILFIRLIIYKFPELSDSDIMRLFQDESSSCYANYGWCWC